MAQESFVGTWKLLSFEMQRSVGETTYPFGQDAEGFIFYDGDGNVSVQLARADRPSFASGDMQTGTDEEIREAYMGYVAYFGKYDVNEAGGYVTHKVSQSTFPNWKGDAQRRYFKISGDTLTLSTPPMVFGGEEATGVLVWERVV